MMSVTFWTFVFKYLYFSSDHIYKEHIQTLYILVLDPHMG